MADLLGAEPGSVAVQGCRYRMVSLAEKQNAAACLDTMVRKAGA